MCLSVDVLSTENFLMNRAGKTGRVKCWKVFKLDALPHRLYSPIRHTMFMIGENKSDRGRKPKLCLQQGRNIEKGIHVFLNKRKATNSWFMYQTIGDRVVVPVWCDIKDLIGVAYNDTAVFDKITISKAAYEEATNVSPKRRTES